jgi:crossover junction endodeoxyribonuclease RuvC
MTYVCVAGIDLGLTGAIAFYYPTHDKIAVHDMPVVAGDVDAASLCELIRRIQPEIAVFERVASRPQQGVASVFRFGHGAGMVEGVLAACGVPRTAIQPAVWKRFHKLPAEKDKKLAKEQARALALKLWPERSDLFGLKKHHGRSDAALIARYGAQMIP